MPNKRKSYAIASFLPVRMTNKTLFQFYGGCFTEDEKEDYIIWFLTEQGLMVDEIKLDASLEDCEAIKTKDPYIDWNTCSRGYFKQMKKCKII